MNNQGQPIRNPLSLLMAARATQRPQLLELFRRELVALAQRGESLTPELAEGLVNAVMDLTDEVYDLRRTVNAMTYTQRAISQALGGAQRQLEVCNKIAEKGRRGDLPDHFNAQDIIRDVKKEVDREWAEEMQ